MQQKVRNQYDEISPITGNMSVLVEMVDIDGQEVKYKLCMDSGYQTYPQVWKKANVEGIKAVDETTPSYIRDIKFLDNDGVYWYPLIIEGDNALTLIKDEKGDLIWAVLTKPKLEGAMAIMNQQMMDDKPVKTWPKDQFEDAWEYYFSLPEENK